MEKDGQSTTNLSRHADQNIERDKVLSKDVERLRELSEQTFAENTATSSEASTLASLSIGLRFESGTREQYLANKGTRMDQKVHPSKLW